MKSDREFIAGIYEKAARQTEMMNSFVAAGASASTDGLTKERGLTKIVSNITDALRKNGNRGFVLAGAAVAMVLLVTLTTVLHTNVDFGIDNKVIDNKAIDATGSSETGIMSLRELAYEFEVVVNVKDIISEEDIVKIDCVLLRSSNEEDAIGTRVILTLESDEYNTMYPDGVLMDGEYTFTVCASVEGYSIVLPVD
ncbi:MAG: hypothetical protein IJW18_07585 [Lachnospiraceae bacterium]|nr:hypothetical protein [Lachnospiraceae bacterium]